MNKFIITTVTMALGLAVSLASHAQTVYRWVDGEGVVHYGARPPEGVKATMVDMSNPSGGLGVPAAEINPSPGEDAAAEAPEISVAEQRRRDRAERRAETRQENAERQRNCTAMERQRAALEPHPRVIIRDKDGNPTRMADDDRIAKLEEAKQYLEENCQ